jgi:hypothetical protein
MLELAAALERAADAGDFFRLTLLPDGPAAPEGWQPAHLLIDDPAVLAGRVSAGRRLLAGLAGLPESGVERRAAASVVFLGLAARIVAPCLGAAALAGAVPAIRLPGLYWQDRSGSTALGVSRAEVVPLAGSAANRAVVAAELLTDVLQATVVPLLQAFRYGFELSTQVLWGNVASAVGGAVQVLAGAVPAGAAMADAIGRELLGRAPLIGRTEPLPAATRVAAAGSAAGTGWPPRRRSCCLYYRVPGGGLCADCVLTRVPSPRR